MPEESFKALLEICNRLRGEGGCPWDREQTLESMKACVLEEAEEIAEAIDKKDLSNLEEEMGDLIFTLLLMGKIAEEEGHFNIASAMERAKQKLISRHTWVFGEDKAETAEEALAIWKENKKKESKKSQ